MHDTERMSSPTMERMLRKRRAVGEFDMDSPPARKCRNIPSVVVVMENDKKNTPINNAGARPAGRNKRYRRRSASSAESKLRTNSNGDHSSSCDLGYESHRGDWHSAKSKWQGVETARRGMCRCKRHSDSGLRTKSTQNRRRSVVGRPRRDRQRRGGRGKGAMHGCDASRVEVDDEGHLVYRQDEILLERYQLGRVLGQGTFGKVVECRDLARNERNVAMKIVRKDYQDYDAAIMEVKVLEALQTRNGRDERSYCIEMLDWFDYNGHICIVFERLGHSVYEFLRRNAYRPFPIDQVESIAYQLCQSVLYLHERGLTHTDLKPENILFCDSSFDFIDSSSAKLQRDAERRIRRADVRLIDFGSALFDDEPKCSIISTRQYRAPEVLLDLGWGYAADVWSIGCILFELYTGKTLFQIHDTLEHLAMMERVLGRIPSSVCTSSPRTRYFQHGRLKWDESSKTGRAVRHKCRPLKTYMNSRSARHVDLFDLIHSMLKFDPCERMNLREVLVHPFFTSQHRSQSDW